MADERWCDLVLEGGGVKGIGLVGAYTELAKAGYKLKRVAGTSAGAIVGALLAAGMPVDKLVTTMQSLNYKKFRDESFIDTLGIGGKTFSFVFEKGVYEGKFLRNWLADQLAALGVRTFGDLKLTDPWAQHLPPEQRYRLVVIASDISGGRLARLPWDYKRYGLDPDQQLVADAVRASMSIPFFYEPVKLADSFIVDGGMLSNFPIDLFDDIDDWPTFGIKLSARPGASTVTNPVHNTYDFAKAIIATAMSAHDQMHIDDPCTQARTMFVDTFKVQATNFDISAADQQKLFRSGQQAAAEFLTTWNFTEFKKTCKVKK